MAGETRCTDHLDAPLPAEERPQTAFDRALAAGEYDDLLGPRLAKVVAQAAAETSVDNEVGIMRVTMAKLLAEETDPSKLAAGVARLSVAIAQMMRTRHALSGQMADSITDAVATILETITP